MQVIRIKYSDVEKKEKSSLRHRVKTSNVKKENFKWIFDLLMAFTGGNEDKSVALTALCIKETNGGFCGKSKSASSTAAGLFQCTKTAVKDVMSDKTGRKIVEEILPKLLSKKKELIDFDPEKLWILQQSEQTKAVGILLGYAYFEVNLSRFGMYPLAAICAHYLPRAAKVIEKNIEYLSKQESLDGLRIALRMIESGLDRETRKHFSIARDNNNGLDPFQYVVDVVANMVSIYRELKENKRESEIISYLTSPESSHSGSSLNVILTDREHNLCEYVVAPPPVEKSNTELLKEIISGRDEARDVQFVLTAREKLASSDEKQSDQNTEALKRRLASNSRQLSKIQAKAFSRKKDVYSTGFGPYLDPADSIYELFYP